MTKNTKDILWKNSYLNRYFLVTYVQEKIGDAGYRSPCLSHAKRALYHLSYTPMCNRDLYKNSILS